MLLRNLSLLVLLSPLLGSLIAAFLGKLLGKRVTHVITIGLMLISSLVACFIFKLVVYDHQFFTGTLYTWGMSGHMTFPIGILVDRLAAVMMVVVTFVSTLVHLYSIGYMKGDPGDQRFFCYMSLFTFAMLLLVLADNFLQIFMGWEGVGLVSYLLIGFWFKKDSAADGSLKAFLVNRFGDLGFILGIAAIVEYFGSLDYFTVFHKAHSLAQVTINILPNTSWNMISVVCVLLFIGAMAKSAQIPLHVWLPESMEGPTPISALIHAATMVTAGVYMVARLSPLFELSQTALSMVLVVGATGGLFLGLLAFVENDLKRIIAYSTMSQLGYMMAANGASAFSAGIFHLATHACFKALLFLGAGSVILAMHHEQDIRKMGGLRRSMPITYVTFLIGSLALAAIPPFSGFYSKDAIISAVHLATVPGAHYAYACLVLGSFVTAYYIFRAFFMTFHGKCKVRGPVKESAWTMTLPLILLAIPSVFLGMLFVKPMLFQFPGVLGNSIRVLPEYNVLAILAQDFHGVWSEIPVALTSLPFLFGVVGIVTAWLTCITMPSIPGVLAKMLKPINLILKAKYGFDAFNDFVFVKGGRFIASLLYRVGDVAIVDDFFVNGTGRSVTFLSKAMRRMQTGFLFQYVFVMILGLLAFLIWLIWWK